ncbi:MAG: LuxR C-terminal-related transcriptional regulator [Anaerolineaceae bacterium]|nr:LuxR C-terminal-related transcriptional regulator [Anaerolineaceae bacterium]
MSTLFIFYPDGSSTQQESKELAYKVVQAINEGLWEAYLPYPASMEHAWKAMQLDQRVLVYSPIPESSLNFPPIHVREIQLLQLLVSGHSFSQIAWMMHIHLRTIYAQLARLRRKLHARSNFELVAMAVKFNLAEPGFPED